MSRRKQILVAASSVSQTDEVICEPENLRNPCATCAKKALAKRQICAHNVPRICIWKTFSNFGDFRKADNNKREQTGEHTDMICVYFVNYLLFRWLFYL